MTVDVGGSPFVFRTLSLYDVWCLWPHIAPLAEAMKKGRPIQFAENLIDVLRVLNPVLVSTPDWAKKITPLHVNLLIEFYRREHDWKRIEQLGERSPASKSEPLEAAEAENNFFVICLGAARFANMDVKEFVDCRFEFCADAIAALHRTLEAQQPSGMNVDQFVNVMSAVLPTERVTAETKPEWMKELESRGN